MGEELDLWDLNHEKIGALLVAKNFKVKFENLSTNFENFKHLIFQKLVTKLYGARLSFDGDASRFSEKHPR